MIDLPRRPVTRFMVPLIDVLILLFCIFLLMPWVSGPGDGVLDRDLPDPNAAKDADTLRAELREANRRVERLLADRDRLAERMNVTVLEIDAATGRLYSFEPDAPEPRQEVRDAADAQRVIDRAKRTAGAKEAFVLILYPRTLTGFPLKSQVEAYRRWFQAVPSGFDNPWLKGSE